MLKQLPSPSGVKPYFFITSTCICTVIGNTVCIAFNISFPAFSRAIRIFAAFSEITNASRISVRASTKKSNNEQHFTTEVKKHTLHNRITWVYGKFAPTHVHSDVIESTVEGSNAHSITETNTNRNPNFNPNPCHNKSLVLQ